MLSFSSITCISNHHRTWNSDHCTLRRWRARIGCSVSDPVILIISRRGGFICSSDDRPYSNVMFHFLHWQFHTTAAAAAPSDLNFVFARRPANRARHAALSSHGYQVHVGPMNSNSRGSVLAVSPDIADKPAIRFNYLSTPEDEEEWSGCRRFKKRGRFLSQPAFNEFNVEETSPVRSSAQPRRHFGVGEAGWRNSVPSVMCMSHPPALCFCNNLNMYMQDGYGC